MSSTLRKLPPEVVRELRRHVSPKPLPKPGQQQQATQQQQKQASSNSRSSKTLPYVLAGCLGLTATAASFPLIATWWVGNLNEKDAPLTGNQARRGAFNNSGSRDVGKDPNWDFQKGEYKKETGYAAIYEQEKKQKKLPGQFMAMPDEALQKHEKNMLAFAKGEKRNALSSPSSSSSS